MSMKMPKEPSRNFFKLFFMLFVIDVLISIIVYAVSPEQVPSRFAHGGFEKYRSKLDTLFSQMLIHSLLLPVALMLYKFQPVVNKYFIPRITLKFIHNVNIFLMGTNYKRISKEDLTAKYISVTTLILSCTLILFNLVVLGFAFELPDVNNLSIFLIIGIIILIFQLFRIFSKLLES